MSQSPENPAKVNPTPDEGPFDPARRRVVRDGLAIFGASVSLFSVGDFVCTMLGYGATIESEVDAVLGTAVPKSGGSQEIIAAFHQTVDDSAATAVASGGSHVTVPITNPAGLSVVFEEREGERLREELRERVATEMAFPGRRIVIDLAGMLGGAAVIGGTALTEPRRAVPSSVK